jgi:hypothetical protein
MITPEMVTKWATALGEEPMNYRGQISGGHKTAIFFQGVKSRKRSVLLTCPARWQTQMASGLAIQQRMKILYPMLTADVIGLDLDGRRTGRPTALVTQLPGSDLETRWNDLDQNETLIIAQTMAGVLRSSEGLFFDQHTANANGGCGKHLLNEKPPYESMAHYLEILLQEAIEHAIEGRQPEVVSFAHRLLDSLQHSHIHDLLYQSPRSTFVFDFADRNILVKCGSVCGLVDMDELFTGDPWFEIALSDVYLTLARVRQRQTYIGRWQDTWKAQENDLLRMDLYRAVLGVERQARAGPSQKPGRYRPILPSGMMEMWVNQVDISGWSRSTGHVGAECRR